MQRKPQLLTSNPGLRLLSELLPPATPPIIPSDPRQQPQKPAAMVEAVPYMSPSPDPDQHHPRDQLVPLPTEPTAPPAESGETGLEDSSLPIMGGDGHDDGVGDTDDTDVKAVAEAMDLSFLETNEKTIP